MHCFNMGPFGLPTLHGMLPSLTVASGSCTSIIAPSGNILGGYCEA